MSSTLLQPSNLHPIVALFNETTPAFKFEPYRSTTATVSYLRFPVEPVFVVTIDANDNITYNSGASTELEWDEEEKVDIIYLILQKVGVNLDEQDALQYGLAKENS